VSTLTASIWERSFATALAIVLAVGIIVSTAPSAVAQTPGQAQPAGGAALSPALRARVDRLADSARTLAVPTDPLYLKAAEGALKGASDDRVSDVVRRLLGELVEARRVLGAEASGAELVAGASVIHARVDPALLRRVRDAHREVRSGVSGTSLVMPLVVLADLVARRVSPDVATSAVVALAERGVADQELAKLRSSIEREIGGGLTPDAAARARTTVMLRELGGEARRSAPPRVVEPAIRP
jgi:hypothetical protein